MKVNLVMINTDGDEYPTLPFELERHPTANKREMPEAISMLIAAALFETTNTAKVELRDAATGAPIKTVAVEQIDLLLFERLHTKGE